MAEASISPPTGKKALVWRWTEITSPEVGLTRRQGSPCGRDTSAHLSSPSGLMASVLMALLSLSKGLLPWASAAVSAPATLSEKATFSPWCGCRTGELRSAQVPE